MNAPTLFDSLHPSDVRVVVARARHSDPATSHSAAAVVSPGCKDCIDAITLAVFNAWEPLTAFDIAEEVEWKHPGRWDEGTIRRRVKDAGLTFVDEDGLSPRGRACSRWTLGDTA